MNPLYEDLALLRAREPGLKSPTRHPVPHERHKARHQIATVLRRVASRLDA